MFRPTSARLFAAGTIGAIAVVEAVVGWMLFFSFVQIFDDEGYMVTMYREWVGGGALYDQVYSQYGPFHTVVVGLPFRLFGLPFTLTTGRCITLTLFIGTTVLLALAALKITRSLLSAVLAQLITFWTMWTVVTAPLHPVALLMFLLTALVVNLAVARPRWPRISDWVTGGIIAAVLLTKANVGLFAAIAVAYAVAMHWPTDRVRRWLLPLTELALVAVGPVLLVSQGDVAQSSDPLFGARDPHVLQYWMLAYVSAAVTVVVFGRLRSPRRPDDLAPFSPWRLAAGFGLVAGASVGVVLLTGTSVRALIDGVLVRPLDQANALTILPDISSEMLVLLIAVPLLIGAGYAISRAAPSRGWYIASGTLRVVGALLLLIVMAAPFQAAVHATLFGGPFAYVPLAALVVLPRVGDSSGVTMSRSFVAALAVAQSLHAFPVAGVQLFLALLFPIFSAVVVLDDGVREYAAALASIDRQSHWRLASRGITVAVLLWAGWQERDAMRIWIDQYQEAAPLNLPDSAWMRADPVPLAATKDLLTKVQTCSQLITYPGTYTLNIWAEIPPPNGFNTTEWPGLLNDREQQATVDVLERAEDPVCFVVRDFNRSRLDPQGGPLERYLADFVPRSEADGYQILVRPS